MKDVKFGVGQLQNATPAFIGRLRKLLLYIMGGIGVFMPLVVEWTGWPPEKLIQLLGFITFGLTGLAEFFGVPLEGKTVASADVTEVETHGLNTEDIKPTHKDGN